MTTSSKLGDDAPRRYEMNHEHHMQVRKALAALQEAQNLVNEACRQLCSVTGIGTLYGDTCKLGDQVKAHWHRLERQRMARFRKEMLDETASKGGAR